MLCFSQLEKQFKFGIEGMTEFVVYTEIGPKNHSGSYNALGIAIWTHYTYMSRFLLPSKGASEVLSTTERISYESALGSTSSLPTLKPIPPKSPPGLPGLNLSHVYPLTLVLLLCTVGLGEFWA